MSLLDTILWLIGLLAEAGVVGLAIKGKLFRITPVFCSYLAWCLLNDISLFFLNRYFGPSYFRIYLIEMALDSVFQFAVLVELGWSVLRPIRSSLPRYSITVLALLIGMAGAVIWPISARMIPSGSMNHLSILLVHGQETVAVLRVVIFMALAGFSQLLSISWRNRELQIATGLGFYSMCSLAVSIIHSHQTVHRPGEYNGYYHALDQIGVAAYLCSLVYWIISFSQQEQERQEFTPEMRSFLLAVTGAARGTRMALADSGLGGSRKAGKP